jgi:uncharacterized membrane protein YtjA (UPF0391 family)
MQKEVEAKRERYACGDAPGVLLRGEPSGKVGRQFGFRITRITITRRILMLQAAIAFFILAIIAAIFGFGGIAAGASSIAQILFFVFLVLFIISALMNVMRGRNPV